MCGIAGIASRTPSDLTAPLRRMRDLIAHRGPDAAGEKVTPHVALGIRRLAIVDLLTGDQPQCNEDGTVWTVFNGEIYNFQELREELSRKGHRLVTEHSDTETIVHLYEDLGERFVERLEGMFAIAVWDTRTGTLVLARDRMGKKPLLYVSESDRLTFASEHASLLAGLRGRPSIDPQAVRRYLRLGYVPAPGDAFAGLQKLPPAHVLVWRDGTVALRRYWTPPQAGTLTIGEEDAVLELRRLLRAAVARRLIADVPIGAFLSGGVDSSGVVATMAELTPHVRTFSIGFDDAAYSELPHARRIAERYGTEHHEFVVRPEGLEVLDQLVRHYGEPYADSSAVPTFFLSKLTRRHVTVALNGDGGDELFAGYERHQAAQIASRFDRAPLSAAKLALWLVGSVLPDSLSPRSRARRVKRFVGALSLPPSERYLRWLGVFDTAQLAPLLDPAFAAETAGADDVASLTGQTWTWADPIATAQAIDRAVYLPDDLLVKVDIASMANSLEVRSPLLDRELVEFAISLPTSLKIKAGERKYVLKKALADRVPRENMYRPKQGFGVPVGAWFRGDLGGFAEDIILSARARGRGYFRPDVLERLVRDHTSGREDHTHRVWSLLMLELWHRAFTDPN